MKFRTTLKSWSRVRSTNAEPRTVEPRLIEPEIVEPGTFEPEIAESGIVEPTIEPGTFEPKTVDSETVEPKTIESEILESTAVESFCERCCQLHEYAANVTEHNYYDLSTDLPIQESCLELMNSKCGLCRFLGDIGISKDDTGGGEVIWSRNITSILEHNDHATRSPASVPLFKTRVGGKTFSLLRRNPTRDELIPRHVVPDSINYSLVKDWIEFCRCSHVDTCGHLETRSIPGFKVIDCRTGNITNPEPEAKYVALSYLWGSDHSLHYSKDSWPLTIKDSITLTLRLGFEYLWVDRYCIDQNNSTEKHAQIQNMDYIYSRAELTIIAAAGKDPHYGLPGVSSTHRISQKRISIGEIELVQLFLYDTDLQDSPWASRAWTLQEGFLSRRRLVFTDHEITFLCNRMQCRESVQNRLIAPESNLTHGLVLNDYQWRLGWRPTGFTSPEATAILLMNQSSIRNLSYDEDALNVCIGILKHLGIRHWWGSIVFPANLDIFWRKSNPARRREGFPSWSWVSVTGLPERQRYDRGFCTVEMPLADTKWQTLNDWATSTSVDDYSYRRKSLRVTGSIITPMFISGAALRNHQISLGETPPASEISKLVAVYGIEKGDQQARIAAPVLLDDAADNLETLSDAVALVWYKGTKKTQIEDPTMMIMKPTLGGYRRVGWSGGWNVFDLRKKDLSSQGHNNSRVMMPPIPVPPLTTFELF